MIGPTCFRPFDIQVTSRRSRSPMSQVPFHLRRRVGCRSSSALAAPVPAAGGSAVSRRAIGRAARLLAHPIAGSGARSRRFIETASRAIARCTAVERVLDADIGARKNWGANRGANPAPNKGPNRGAESARSKQDDPTPIGARRSGQVWRMAGALRRVITVYLPAEASCQVRAWRRGSSLAGEGDHERPARAVAADVSARNVRPKK
jgi:hypothetical protein